MFQDNLLIKRIKILMGGSSNRSFANKCGLSEGPIRNLLKGGEWDSKTLKRIAEAHGKPLWWFFADSDLDREAAEVREEKLSPDVKQDLMEMTSEVLDSETVYRPALVSNIRAFHHGVRQMSKTDGKVDELMREIAELKQMILGMSPERGTEKKRAGNDH